MIPVQNSPCLPKRALARRTAVKGQGEHGVQIVLLQGILLRALRQARKARRLAEQALFHLGTCRERSNPALITLCIGLCLRGLPELLLYNAQLLPQHEFTLTLVKSQAKFLLILMPHPHDIDFARQLSGQHLVKFLTRIALEQALSRPPGPGKL